MDPAEQWAACVIFGELGMNARAPLRYDWTRQVWDGVNGD
jgi:hypothetical protein